jgi:peptidoglycan hydrolase CwlO-like protein
MASKHRFLKLFLIISLTIILVIFLNSVDVLGQAGQEKQIEQFEQIKPTKTVEEKIEALSNEEFEIMQHLFNLALKLDNIKNEQATLEKEVAHIKNEIDNLNESLHKQQLSFEKTCKGVENVLKSYQRMGPASYLEIILESKHFGDFLRRLNILKDLSRNTYKQLTVLEESKKQLELKQKNREELLHKLNKKQAELESSSQKIATLQAEQSKLLVGIQDQKVKLTDQLFEMQELWSSTKPYLLKSLETLSRVIQRGELPEDGVKITFTLKGIQATITQKTFNQIIENHPVLPNINFEFLQDIAVMDIPQQKLKVKGTFVIVGKSSILYDVREGTFYDLPLDEKSLQELFLENLLKIDFQPVIGSNQLNSIKIKDGQIELTIMPSFLLD